jgi:peptidoglycan/LPS O-acetylase OafA/YrhL
MKSRQTKIGLLVLATITVSVRGCSARVRGLALLRSIYRQLAYHFAWYGTTRLRPIRWLKERADWYLTRNLAERLYRVNGYWICLRREETGLAVARFIISEGKGAAVPSPETARVRRPEAEAARSRLPKHRYLPALDGIRALSMGYVMCNHLVSSIAGKPGNSPSAAALVTVGERGWFGVDVFFVLSGFLITWILAEELESSGNISFRRFYLRRFLRLVPAYYSAIFLGIVLTGALSREALGHLLRSLPLLVTYTLNFAVAAGYPSPAPLGVAWSLCIEEQFYLLWPLALFALGERRAFRLAVGSVFAVLAWRTCLYLFLNGGLSGRPTLEVVQRIQFATDTRIDVILVGCSLALAMRMGKAPWLWDLLGLRYSSLYCVALLCFAVALFGDIQGGAPRLCLSLTIGYTVMALCVAAVLAGIILKPNDGLSKFLGGRWLVFVGGISYGGYLFHVEVFYLLSHGLKRYYSGAMSVPMPTAALGVFAFFAGTILVSYCHFQCVERRFAKLKPKPIV